MTDIIKTWPANGNPRSVAQIFGEDAAFCSFYFTLGRGKPKVTPTRIWFTYRGRVLGSFRITRIVQNDGTLPELHRLDGGPSGWQIKPDMWVAICEDGCSRIKERVFHSGFRGWRYFNFDHFRTTVESRIRL